MIESLQERVLKVLFMLIWALALIHMTAEYYFLYWTFRWFDIVTHFLGGVWVGVAMIWVWHFSGYIRKTSMPDVRTLYVALLGGLLVGLVWELYEYVVWMWTGEGLPINYIPDTTLDVCMDVLGSLFGFVMLKQFLFTPHLKKQEQ